MITNIGFSIGIDRSLALYVFDRPARDNNELASRLGEFSKTLGHYWRMNEYVQSTCGWPTSRMIHRCCTTQDIETAMTQVLRHAATASRTLQGGEQAIEEVWVPALIRDPGAPPLTPYH